MLSETLHLVIYMAYAALIVVPFVAAVRCLTTPVEKLDPWRSALKRVIYIPRARFPMVIRTTGFLSLICFLLLTSLMARQFMG